MKKLLLSFLSIGSLSLMAQAPVIGTWKCTFIGVGPSKGDYGWYNTAINANVRPCLADDEYVFSSDGTFENILGSETWLETWQGATADGCGTPVAPHDGKNKGSWRYDAGAGKVTIIGKGNYLGITKPYNGGELDATKTAPDSIVYEVSVSGNDMSVDVNFGGGYWHYDFKKQGGSQTIETNATGNWGMHFMGVGPAKGDVSWFSTALNSSTRSCLADDEYQFSSDGTFKNVLGSETWLETWQGVAADGCGAAKSPFDGTNAGTWKDNGDGTISVIGKGSYLGIPKVYNGGELKSLSEAKDTITYEIKMNDAKDTMNVDISWGGGYWHFAMHKIVPKIETNPKGDWKMTFLGVGPSKGNVSWYSTNINESARPCLADDIYSFADNGSFTNNLGTETWLETWQGATAEGCGTPVAPHDGKTAGTWKDNTDGTVTVSGKGNYLGLAKVINGGELSNPANAPENITYEMSVVADTMIADIAIKTGDGTPAYWHFRFLRFNPSNASETLNNQSIMVYPNPSSDKLWISNAKENSKVIIRTLEGRVCLSTTLSNAGIDISNLKLGVYLIEVETAMGTATAKWLKN